MRYWLFMLCCLPHFLAAQARYPLVGLLNFGPQANILHPAYTPAGKIFFGYPVLSQISILANHRFSFRDIALSGVDPLDILGTHNSLGIDFNVNTLLIGFKPAPQHYASLFVNNRVTGFLYYPKTLMTLLWKGNAEVGGEEKTIDGLQVEAMAYREMGIGYNLPIDRNLQLGVHLKYLIGVSHVSTAGRVQVDYQIDQGTYAHRIHFKHFELRTSLPPNLLGTQGGVFSAKDLIYTDNTGIALDLGASYVLNSYMKLNVSLRDIGFIHWKVNAQRYTIDDPEVTITGTDLLGGDIQQGLRDDLLNGFGFTKEAYTYRALLYYNFVSTFSVELSSHDFLSTSNMLKRLPGRWRLHYSLSYLRHLGKRFSCSISAIGYPQQLDVGLALLHNMGLVQLYVALGNTVSLFDLPSTKGVSFNFGINIISGRDLSK